MYWIVFCLMSIVLYYIVQRNHKTSKSYNIMTSFFSVWGEQAGSLEGYAMPDKLKSDTSHGWRKNLKGWIHTQTEGTPVRQLHQGIEPCLQKTKRYQYTRNKK